MTKKFFIFAFAAFAAICTTACSSSDDDSEGPGVQPVNLDKPKYSDKAAEYKLTTTVASDASKGVEGFELKSIDVTPSGRVMLELQDNKTGKKSYVVEEAVIQGDKYIMNGSKVKGSFEIVRDASRTTRAQGVVILIDITIILSDNQILVFLPAGEVLADMTLGELIEEAVQNIARKWDILGAIIDLKSSTINAYEEFDSDGGVFHMSKVLKEAEEQGVKLTVEERTELSKMIQSIELTDDKFIIRYTDNSDDVATWEWVNSDKSAFTIRFKDTAMGNKFISNNSRVEVAYNGKLCNLKLYTNIVDDAKKAWDIALTLKLRAAE